MKKNTTLLRHRLADERGQSAAEFALVAPVLIMLVLGAIQFGIAFNTWVTLTDAARAGARRAIVARFNGGSTADAEQAVRNSAATLNQTDLKVFVTDDHWNTPGSVVTVKTTYPYSITIPLLGLKIASGNLTATSSEELE
jgi:Flp pilus assembly protein TadG